MNATGISYLDLTWNVTPGCTHGCEYCWARRQLKRQKHRCVRCYGFGPHLHAERLGEPEGRKKPGVIGVSFTGDLFDPAMSEPEPGFVSQGPRDWQVFEAMRRAPWHTYVIPTKQPGQVLKRLRSWEWGDTVQRNWWILASVSDQATLDAAASAVRQLGEAGWNVGLSIEPMLGEIDLSEHLPQHDFRPTHSYWRAVYPSDGKPILLKPGVRCVIVGGESGPNARPMHPDWVRSIRDQCAEAGVPFYFKQWGEWLPYDQATQEQQSNVKKGTCRPAGSGSPCCPGHWIKLRKEHAGRLLDGVLHDKLPWRCSHGHR